MIGKKISAAVLLTRGSDEQFEVYLAKRSEKLRFFGGYFALPGGVIDAGDASQDGSSEEAGLRRCAARELFEEVGVLIPPLSSGVKDSERDSLREGLLESSRTEIGKVARDRFQQLSREDGTVSAFHRIYRITTPPFGPMRYRAVYYQAWLPEGEEPSIIDGELTEGRFFRVEEALSDWANGDLLLPPPVVFLMERLSGRPLSQGMEEATTAAAELEAGKIHPVRFTPGVVVLTVKSPTHPPAGTTNCFLIGTRRIFVLDPAATEDDERKRLFEAIDDRLKEGGKVEGVILSHHHPDHVGSAAHVAERFAVPILAHPLTFSSLPDFTVETIPIEDGHVLQLGSMPDRQEPWELRALHTPGHARGHLAFIENRYRSAFAADLVSTVSTIVIFPDEGHLGTYLKSLSRLGNEDITYIYPAHGIPERRGKKVLQHFLEHREKREQKLLTHLTGDLCSVPELLSTVYDDADPKVHHLAQCSLVSGLRKLEEEGKAVEEEGCWRKGSSR